MAFFSMSRQQRSYLHSPCVLSVLSFLRFGSKRETKLYIQPVSHKLSTQLPRNLFRLLIFLYFDLQPMFIWALFILEPIWPCSDTVHGQFMRQHCSKVSVNQQKDILVQFCITLTNLIYLLSFLWLPGHQWENRLGLYKLEKLHAEAQIV